jgi:hypothetical protein
VATTSAKPIGFYVTFNISLRPLHINLSTGQLKKIWATSSPWGAEFVEAI